MVNYRLTPLLLLVKLLLLKLDDYENLVGMYENMIIFQ